MYPHSTVLNYIMTDFLPICYENSFLRWLGQVRRSNRLICNPPPPFPILDFGAPTSTYGKLPNNVVDEDLTDILYLLEI